MSAYQFLDLLNYVSQDFPRLQADGYGAMMLDQCQSMIWNSADWRVALSKLAPFYVVPLEQDYIAPLIAIPTDFLGLRTADLVYNGTEPPYRYPPMTVDRWLPLTPFQGMPTAISYEPTVSGFRLHPRPPSGVGPMDYQIEATYKKRPTKVTANTLTTALPFDDVYFSVWVAGLRAIMKKSPEELTAFMRGPLADMRAAEAINLGEQPIAPAQALVFW